MASSFNRLFEVSKPIIGMIHVPALPGTPGHALSVDAIIERCLEDGQALKNGGVHGILIENMHDVPYLNRHVGPEITAMMSVIGKEIKYHTQLPCGIQILAGANEPALAAAMAGCLQFIRAEGFVYGHVADEGYMNADAPTLLRKRKSLGADHIYILTDVKKKHASHTITGDVDLLDTAHSAAFFGADGLVITGTFTGKPPDLSGLLELKNAVTIPLIIGSGMTSQNIHRYYNLADAFFVGSFFKVDGKWENRVDEDRVSLFMKQVALLK